MRSPCCIFVSINISVYPSVYPTFWGEGGYEAYDIALLPVFVSPPNVWCLLSVSPLILLPSMLYVSY
jgi:hypothetical protein